MPTPCSTLEIWHQAISLHGMLGGIIGAPQSGEGSDVCQFEPPASRTLVMLLMLS